MSKNYTPEELQEFASMATDSIINGNTGSIIADLKTLNQKQAIAATALICLALVSWHSMDDMERFVKRLSY